MSELCWAWLMNHSVTILYNIYNMLLLLITCLFGLSVTCDTYIYITKTDDTRTIYSTSIRRRRCIYIYVRCIL